MQRPDFEDLFGLNAAYAEKVYGDYLAAPDSVTAEWRHWFESTLPPELRASAGAGTVRTLHQFAGKGLTVEGQDIPGPAAVQVQADQSVTIEANRGPIEILLLQGRPIGEPVAQHGPFVMNTRAELEQAFRDYQRTQFGGWPFPDNAPVHPRAQGRFAKHADGRVENAEEHEHAAP